MYLIQQSEPLWLSNESAMSTSVCFYNLPYFREILLTKEELSTAHLYEKYMHELWMKREHLDVDYINHHFFNTEENAFLMSLEYCQIPMLKEILMLSVHNRELDLVGFVAFLLLIVKLDKIAIDENTVKDIYFHYRV